MKSLLTILCFMAALSGISQEKGECFIDRKTGDTIRDTKWYNVENQKTYMLNFRFVRINSSFTLELKYHFGEEQRFSVNKGDSLWIKLENGYTVTLYSQDSVKSKKAGATYAGSMKGLVTPGVYVKYPLTIGQMVALTISPIEKFRIFSSRGFDNIVLSTEERSSLQRASALIIPPVKSYKIKDRELTEDVPKEQKTEEW